jgi:hypothetical protein
MARVTPNGRRMPRVWPFGVTRGWCGGAAGRQASAAVMPTVDSMTGFIFLSSAS